MNPKFTGQDLALDVVTISYTITTNTENKVGSTISQLEAVNKQRNGAIDQIYIKTPNPKCRLYWCQIESEAPLPLLGFSLGW